MNVKNEIKSIIVRSGMTMQQVVDLLSEEYGWSDSISNFSNKLSRGFPSLPGSDSACGCDGV